MNHEKGLYRQKERHQGLPGWELLCGDIEKERGNSRKSEGISLIIWEYLCLMGESKNFE